MSLEDKRRITVLIISIIFMFIVIGFSINKDMKKVAKCHNLGGIYVGNQCFEAKIIELN